jgi:serine phosphatase RsbU (regulator of sigma subunit)
MTIRATLHRVLDLPPISLVRMLFHPRPGSPARPSDPLRSDVPGLRNAEIAALYHNQRIAGDFYEFLRLGPSRVLFGLLDIAGRRGDTREILIAAQSTLRRFSARLFARADVNEAEAMIELCHQVNRTILHSARGVRSCPTFLGCYNEDLGTVCYANAGHTPALLRDAGGITRLTATGLPLGLFSHATHGAATCALVPGSALVIASRGIVEAESGDEEFGLEGVEQVLRTAAPLNAPQQCLDILQAAQEFTRTPLTNDMTALTLLRAILPEPHRN